MAWLSTTMNSGAVFSYYALYRGTCALPVGVGTLIYRQPATLIWRVCPPGDRCAQEGAKKVGPANDARAGGPPTVVAAKGPAPCIVKFTKTSNTTGGRSFILEKFHSILRTMKYKVEINPISTPLFGIYKYECNSSTHASTL